MSKWCERIVCVCVYICTVDVVDESVVFHVYSDEPAAFPSSFFGRRVESVSTC